MDLWEIEQKVIEELNDFYYNKLNFCGCGSPQDILLVIKNVLNAINQKWEDSKSSTGLDWYDKHQDRLHQTFEFADHSKPKNKFTGIQSGIIDFVLNKLDSVGILEHGGSIGGAWLSEYGKRILHHLNSLESLENILD